jgi:hypothetical protein
MEVDEQPKDQQKGTVAPAAPAARTYELPWVSMFIYTAFCLAWSSKGLEILGPSIAICIS